MTLTQMQYFDALCRYENYTKAAAALYVSQPAISQAIRDLENECGVPLILRRANGLSVTEEGRVLLAEIQHILRQTENLQTMIKTIGLSRNYVRVGVSTFSGNQVFPQICCKFYERYPEIQIMTQETDTPTLFQMLDNDRVDLILTAPGSHGRRSELMKKYNLYDVALSGLCYCVARNSPMARKETVTLAEIAAYPLIMLSQEYASARTLRKMFSDCGIEPRIISTTTQMYTIERFVECGAAGGFLPADIEKTNRNIVALNCPEARPLRHTSLIWKKKSMLFPAVEKFVQVTKELYPQIKQE